MQQAPTHRETPQGERVTCSIPGPRNDRGRPRLLATIDYGGIWVFCAMCKQPHYLEKGQVIAYWERGESVLCEVAPDEQAV